MPRLTLLATALALAGCAPDHAVLGRAYEVRLPKGFDGSTPLPLVIMVHGYGATGQLQDQFFPVSGQLAARPFLYALPNGTPDAYGKRFWNATEACCDFGRVDVDDVAFFRALVDDIAARYPVRAGHVFLVGHSNGAFMSLRLACEAGDVFSGVVAVAGSTFQDPTRCQPGQPVPILLAHGDQDSSVPIEGRPDRFPGARETGARFARRNGCTGGWVDGERLDLLGGADAETQGAVVEGCPPKGSVELWTHENVGHLPLYDARWTARIIDWLEARAR
ncbi:MAG: alpha/beta fold hydrolase [Myxococcaceae bacterium]|jgi:polyhydroxybutyrate depolymerase|nr:alpha/beta fold hydrolase [Myxococcaceae bacterium]MCA3013428.1 alpha/beta fold hydrolase [Myxococcaceae bacterium]